MANLKIKDANGNWIGITSIKGEQGPPGKDGTMSFADLTEEQKASLKGEPGTNGKDGKDGTSCTHSWNGTTLTVTSASGTSSANLKGEPGEPGKDGADAVVDYPTLINLFYPVGTYYETSDATFNPNTAWGGTWVLEEDGTVLVSKSDNPYSKFNTNVGTIIGEEEHQLTVDEIPNHKHWAYYKNNEGPFDIPDWSFAIPNAEQVVGDKGFDVSTNFVGGGLSHNNIQPSKIINRWHRTA